MNGNKLVCIPGYLGGYDLPICSARVTGFAELSNGVIVFVKNDRGEFVLNMKKLPLWSVVDIASVWLYQCGLPFPYHKLGG